MNIVRQEKEINDVLDQCTQSENEGSSQFPFMTYEQGVKAGIEWLLGNTNENPVFED